MSSWNQFCQRIFSQNMFAIKMGVEPIKLTLQKEGLPHLKHRRIIVAGTNGKGFVGAAISNMLQAHGYKVGFFSSPHICSFEERFRVNGKPLEQEKIASVGERFLDRYGKKELEHPLTFFEICTLMAAQLFADESVDFGVYEIGLGGRLDAVRGVAPADALAITTIGFDHTEYLGTTLESICFEKGSLITETIIY